MKQLPLFSKCTILIFICPLQHFSVLKLFSNIFSNFAVLFFIKILLFL